MTVVRNAAALLNRGPDLGRALRATTDLSRAIQWADRLEDLPVDLSPDADAATLEHLLRAMVQLGSQVPPTPLTMGALEGNLRTGQVRMQVTMALSVHPRTPREARTAVLAALRRQSRPSMGDAVDGRERVWAVRGDTAARMCVDVGERLLAGERHPVCEMQVAQVDWWVRATPHLAGLVSHLVAADLARHSDLDGWDRGEALRCADAMWDGFSSSVADLVAAARTVTTTAG